MDGVDRDLSPEERHSWYLTQGVGRGVGRGAEGGAVGVGAWARGVCNILI